MANSGRGEGSHCQSGLCDSQACGTCNSNFTFWCGIYWWVERSGQSGTVKYKLQIYASSSYWRTYTLNCYDTYLNGGGYGTIYAPSTWRTVGNWYDLGPSNSTSFRYNDNGTAPAVRINGGGASFRCVPYCRGSWTTSIGGFDVYPDAVTPDWNRKPGSVTGSASNATCNGIKLSFNVGDAGVPSNISTQIQYGATTSYGQSTASSSAKSGSFNITGLQGGTTYHYRVKTTNSTGTTYSPDYTFNTKGSKPTSNKPEVTSTAPYALKFVLSNIVWEGNDGCTATTKSSVLTWTYTMDGRKYTFSRDWTGSSLADTITANVNDPDKVPEDETVSYTWTLTTNIGTTTTSGTVYAQPSYSVYEAGPQTNYEWVECDLYASEKAGINSYKKVRRVSKIV